MRQGVCSGWAVGLALWFLTPYAAAQEGPRAAPMSARERRMTLRRAVEASDRGDHRAAIELAEAVARAGVTPSLDLFLAEEWEALAGAGGLAPDEAARHLAEATGMATRCLRGASVSRRLRQRAQIIADCTALLQRVNPRVARLRLSIAQPPPTALELSVNGRVLRGVERELVVPVAPGGVVVSATAAGRRAFSRELRVAAGTVADVEVALTPLPDAPPAVVAARPVEVPAVVAAPRREVVAPPRVASASPEVRTGGAGPWVLVGVGGGAVAGAVVFFVLQSAANDRRVAACPRDGAVDRCPDPDALARGQAAYDEERTLRDLGVATLVAGGALVGGGVLWHLLTQRRAPTVALAPWRGGIGVSIGGAL